MKKMSTKFWKTESIVGVRSNQQTTDSETQGLWGAGQQGEILKGANPVMGHDTGKAQELETPDTSDRGREKRI